ncbi:hypothetical protein QJS10_CPB18g01606 [Acorus calamus]|uniref:Uncharacterized protein n=1 Tax=Acorus calamus TaxID=4465 RepID=A0AAV9CRT0_ACOCL|nr:hypothetical protein QJS10_CPB18g01606 [Acorus calamus]
MWWLFKSNGPSGFSYSSTAEEVTEGILHVLLIAVIYGFYIDDAMMCCLIKTFGRLVFKNIPQVSLDYGEQIKDQIKWDCNNMLCGFATANERRDREVLQGQNLATPSSGNVRNGS